MNNIHITEHPLVQHKLTVMRDKDTGAKEFRELVCEITTMLGYEATKDITLTEIEVQTPVATARSKVVKGAKLALVPVLRAGLQMVDGFLNLVPAAKVGHLGIYRDSESGENVEYYCKMPVDVSERDVFVLDPLIATGHSVVAAVDKVKSFNPRSIKLLSIVASPEGLDVFRKAHPEVEVYLASLDEGLTENGFIIPGVGDAGNRLYGTK
ncbi:MAG: uracil phosphoribosyltransferase [Clostridia bacterium]|nr:uracil phosphoribosyltransferase [Clostridia bacterium]